jgi:hypothetical protein
VTTAKRHRKNAFAPEPMHARDERAIQTSFVPQTELGRRLWQIRQTILASGQPLLEWEGIERELFERTGEPFEEV